MVGYTSGSGFGSGSGMMYAATAYFCAQYEYIGNVSLDCSAQRQRLYMQISIFYTRLIGKIMTKNTIDQRTPLCEQNN
jgi:hypothetical protein